MLTPDFVTVLRIGATAGTSGLKGRPFRLRRTAKEIGKGVLPGADPSHDVQVVGDGDAIILRERYAELSQVAKSSVAGDVLGAADVNLPPDVAVRNTFRSSTATGLAPAGDVIASGIPSFRKRVRQPEDWSRAKLAVGSLPQPDLSAIAEQLQPLDRLIEGKTAYPENCPFLLIFRLPPNLNVGVDALATFYFGGKASVKPESESGGHFAVTVRGGGTGILWELVETPGEDPTTDPPVRTWAERKRFTIGDTNTKGTLILKVTPYGQDRILITSSDTPLGAGGGLTINKLLSRIAGQKPGTYDKNAVPESLYVDQPAQTGHTHVRTATGSGNIHLDHRRAPRADVSIIRGRYVTSGGVTDGPFAIPEDTPAGTPMKLEIESYTIPNCVVSGGLYDADTFEPLDVDADGNFLSVDGQSRYYAQFSLTTTDGVQTPVLESYTIDVEPDHHDGEAVVIETPTFGAQVTGPDFEPDHELATFDLRDKTGKLALLRTYDQLDATLSLRHRETGELLTHVMEGLLVQTRATRRGRDSHLPDWWDYSCRLVGRWLRLRQQFWQGENQNFTEDPNAPVNPDTDQRDPQPWKVSDAFRRVLGDWGATDDEIDVPDLPHRFWSPDSQDDVQLQYGADILELLAKWARDYVQCAFLRDPNAGPRGMWRVLRNPQPPFTNFIFTLSSKKLPGFTGGFHPMRSEAYGPATSLFEDDSYHRSVRAKEANTIEVKGIADGPDGSRLIKKEWRDQGDIDRRGVIAFTHGPDPALTSEEAVHWQLRTEIALAGTDQEWFEGRTALILVRDTQDANQRLLRPPRVNDLGLVDGRPVIVKSANVTKVHNSDRTWAIDWEGYFLDGINGALLADVPAGGTLTPLH